MGVVAIDSAAMGRRAAVGALALVGGRSNSSAGQNEGEGNCGNADHVHFPFTRLDAGLAPFDKLL